MRILYNTKDFLVDDNSTFRDLLRELKHGANQVTIFTSNDRVVRVRHLDDSFPLYGLGPSSLIAAKDKESTEPCLLGGMHNGDVDSRPHAPEMGLQDSFKPEPSGSALQVNVF